MKQEMELHGINKFPAEEGLTLFPISMNRISNSSQSAETYLRYCNELNNKIAKSTSKYAKVGGIFIYTESLYMHSNEKANKLKSKYIPLLNHHKNAFVKLLSKHPVFIHDAFSYITWSQLSLYYEGDLYNDLSLIKKIYDKDKLFQKYLKEDFNELNSKKYKLDKNQVMFFLEEHLITYLIQKGKIIFPNSFIAGKEKWLLICYPGKPLKAQIYLSKLNPLKLQNSKNKYESCWYDLQNNKLYDFNKIDLDTFQ